MALPITQYPKSKRRIAYASSDFGGVLVYASFVTVALIAVVALALDFALISQSSSEQYNNATYAAEAALAGFVPSECSKITAAPLVDQCAGARMDLANKMAVCDGADNFASCLAKSRNNAIARAQTVSGTNYYLGSKAAQGGPISLAGSSGGKIAFGHCASKTERPAGMPLPAECTNSNQEFCCFEINPSSDIANVTQIEDPNSVTREKFKPNEAAQAAVNFINASRVQLLSDNSGGINKSVFTFFKALGVHTVDLKKGYGIALYDLNRARSGLHPFTPINAVWLNGPTFAPTPTPPPPAEVIPWLKVTSSTTTTSTTSTTEPCSVKHYELLNCTVVNPSSHGASSGECCYDTTVRLLSDGSISHDWVCGPALCGKLPPLGNSCKDYFLKNNGCNYIQ